MDELLQVSQESAKDDVPVERARGANDTPGAAEGEQVVDECAEATAGLGQVGDVLAALVRQLGGIVFGEESAKCLEGPQRLLEVVRDDVGEFLQLLVGMAELDVGLLQFAGAADDGAGELISFSNVSGRTARADDGSVRILDGARADPDLPDLAVRGDPGGFDGA